MNRRGFLKLLAGAAAGAALAPVIKGLPVESSYAPRPRGLAYLVNADSGLFQDLSRSAYPELKAPVADLAGGPITLEHFNKLKTLLKVREKARTEASVIVAVAPGALTQVYKRVS